MDNSPLKIYDEYGFKFFPCHADKTPATAGDWKSKENQISLEKAIQLQEQGFNVGAWIPKNIIVIDLDVHAGKKNGKESFNKINEKYGEPLQQGGTFAVRTAGKGIHLFFLTDEKFSQNTKQESIDLKTNSGYVIAAGSPGYEILWESEIVELPENLGIWLHDCEKNKKKESKKDSENKEFLDFELLPKLLEKLDVTKFRSNDLWFDICASIVSTFGDNENVFSEIKKWSNRDPLYKDDAKKINKRIEKIKSDGAITTGTLIYYLKTQNISEHLISQLTKKVSINEMMNESEKLEIILPFENPDYSELAGLPATKEWFINQGHTSAATILYNALLQKVIYVESEDGKNYYFDGAKFIRLFDIYNIIYSVLSKVLRNFFASLPLENEAEQEESNKSFGKCLSRLNDRRWKESVFKEFNYRENVFHEMVDWDGLEICETITCLDGVIDFKNGIMVKRAGYFSEFRRSCVPYKCDEIINAKEPKNFMSFLSDLMPDKKTLETLKFCMSLCISGKSEKRLFQIWHGEGRNGKSVLVDIIHDILGEEKAYKYETELIMSSKFKNENYDQIGFQGKYFCYSLEAGKNERLNTEKIKELTGNDIINARQIREKRQRFKPTWQLIFIANDLPSFDNDYAIIDRILVIPFKVRFYRDEKEKAEFLRSGRINQDNLKLAKEKSEFWDEIIKEKHSIIRMFIEHYCHLQKKLNGVIPVSTECEIKKQKYIEDNDVTGLFLNENCIIDVNDQSLFVSTDDLCNRYREEIGKDKLSNSYIVKEIMRAEPNLEHTKRIVIVSQYNKETGYPAEIKKQKRGLKYIRLKTVEEVQKEIENDIYEGKTEITDEDLWNVMK